MAIGVDVGKRLIHLPAIAVESLHEHRKRVLAEGHGQSKWVFCDTSGGLLRRQNVMRRSWHPILNAAGLPKIRFHDSRHSTATLLMLCNVQPEIVQEQPGHARMLITMDIYSHVLPTLQKEAAEKMDGMLARRA